MQPFLYCVSLLHDLTFHHWLGASCRSSSTSTRRLFSMSMMLCLSCPTVKKAYSIMTNVMTFPVQDLIIGFKIRSIGTCYRIKRQPPVTCKEHSQHILLAHSKSMCSIKLCVKPAECLYFCAYNWCDQFTTDSIKKWTDGRQDQRGQALFSVNFLFNVSLVGN